MNAYASWNTWSFNSQIGATGGAVEAPASIYTDVAGDIYNGTIYSNWIFVDTMTAKGRDTFPGTFEGLNNNGITVAFVSYGLMALELEDENANSLSITDTITLVLDGVTGTKQEILSLWYYNYGLRKVMLKDRQTVHIMQIYHILGHGVSTKQLKMNLASIMVVSFIKMVTQHKV